jgi:hypothetical protein
MLEPISAEIIYSRERARFAREKADTAPATEAKNDYLAAEARWLALARSYALQNRLSKSLGENERKPISRGARARTYALDPEIVAVVSCAFHDVFDELGLSDSDEVVALRVARRIIELAARGEPDRLKAVILTWVTNRPTRVRVIRAAATAAGPLGPREIARSPGCPPEDGPPARRVNSQLCYNICRRTRAAPSAAPWRKSHCVACSDLGVHPCFAGRPLRASPSRATRWRLYSRARPRPEQDDDVRPLQPSSHWRGCDGFAASAAGHVRLWCGATHGGRAMRRE